MVVGYSSGATSKGQRSLLTWVAVLRVDGHSSDNPYPCKENHSVCMCFIVSFGPQRELVNNYLRVLSWSWAGGSFSCSFWSVSAEGRACRADGLTGGMCWGLPAFTVFRELSGQVATGLWNDKCLTGGKRGRPVSTGGKGGGGARVDL